MSQTYDLGIRITADGRILTAEVKRGQESVQALGDTAQQVGAQTAAALGNIGKSAETLNTTLNRTGVSAAQTAAALRMVPAQVTDIVTGLASGQAPLTVLIQQGGQLKDAFGGVVPAAKALGGYVAGLASTLTIGAAVAAALGYALYSASSEADEFRRNLILTGNVSGLTANRFQEMTAALDDMSGVTRGAAAEALTTMAASGNIGAASIQSLTEAALRMERAGGPAVADTVKQFEELGKKPVEASLALSAQTHYLTLAVYEQIKSLQDQGRTSEAAAVAQKAWADAIEQRVPKMVENIGYLESAWKNVKWAVAEALDAMKSVGREDTFNEKFRDLQIKIAEADEAIANKSINSNRLKQQRAQWAAELQGLIESNKAKEDAARQHAENQQKHDRSVQATAGWDKIIAAQRSGRQKYADELKKLDADRAADLVSEETYRSAKAALAKEYEDKGAKKDANKAAREAAIEQRKLDDLLAEGSGEAKTYAESMALLQKYALEHSDTLKEGTPELERYRAAVLRQITAHTAMGKAWHESTEAAKDAARAQRAWETEHKNQLDLIEFETTAIGQSAEARKIAIALQQVDADTKKRIIGLSDKLSESEREAAKKSIEAEGDKQQALLKTALIKQQALAGAYQLEQENRRFAAESIFDEQARAQAILDIDAESWRQRIALVAEGTAERQRLESAYQQWYANQQAKPAIENMRRIIDGMDRTFHDGFTRMLEQGKADWTAFSKSLANTFKTLVADQIYKMTFGKVIANVADAFVGGQASTGTTGAAGAAAQTAGAAQQGMSLVSMAKGAYSMYSGFSASGGFAGLGQAFTAGSNMTAAEAAAAANAYSTAGMSGTASAIQAGQYAGSAGVTGTGGASAGAAGGSGASSGMAAAGWAAAIIAAIYTGFEWQKRGWFNDNNRGGYWKEGIEVLKKGYSQYDRLFGINRNTNYDAAGVAGTFSADGFEGQTYQDKSRKGGTFRSDKRWTDYSAVSTDLDAYLDSLMRQTVTGVQTTAKTLGLETEKAVQGYLHTFQLQLSENGSFDKAGEKIASELSKVSDELATRLLPNIGDFKRASETASQTLERLSVEFKTTDNILQLLGKTAAQAFGAAGMASADARERLIDYAGGMDGLASKTASFFQHYYSEQERTQKAAEVAQRQINEAFGELGQAVPKDAAAFRALVTAQDLSTEAGAKLFAQLLDLEGAFYIAQKQAEQAADQERALAEQRRQAAWAADRQALTSQQQALQGAADTAQTALDALAAGIGDKLTPATLTLSQQVDALYASMASSYSREWQQRTDQMGQWRGWRDQLQGARGNLADAMFDAKMRLPDADKVALLKAREAQLWTQLGGASDKGAVAGQIQSVLLARIRAEAERDSAKMQADQQQAQTAEQARLASIKQQRDDDYQLQRNALTLAQQRHEAERDALKQQLDGATRLADIAHRLSDSVAAMAYDDISSLNYKDQLAAARSQYDQTVTQARAGNTDALAQLAQIGQAYRQEARTYYGGTEAFARIDAEVRATLGSLATTSVDPAGIERQLAVLGQQLQTDRDQLQLLEDQYQLASKQADLMQSLRDNTVNTAAREIELLSNVDRAFADGLAQLDAGIDGQVDGLQQLADAMNSNGFGPDLTGLINNLPADLAGQFARYLKPEEDRALLQQQLAAAQKLLDAQIAKFNQDAARHQQLMQQLQTITSRLTELENNARLVEAGK